MTAAERLGLLSLLAFGSLVPSIAHADGGSADALFREGRTLLDAKRYDEACPKLAESERLEPGAGTLLALALCHEGQGKTATAWSELNEAAAFGRRVGRNDLAKAAEKRANAMSLSKLVVRLPPEGASYDVKRDGAPVTDIASTVAVDPGEHTIAVSAPGKVARSYVVRLAGASTVEIVVDRLEDVAAAPTPVAMPARIAAPPDADEHVGRGQRIAGLALIGVGVVGLGAGAVFGGRALSQSSESKRLCPTTSCPDGAAQDANDRSKESFKASVISLSAGVGAIALGAVVYALSPDAEKPARARLVPDAGPSHAGLTVIGAF